MGKPQGFFEFEFLNWSWFIPSGGTSTTQVDKNAPDEYCWYFHLLPTNPEE